MKALVFEDVGCIELKQVKDPVIQEQTDAIIRITTTAICGTDLHIVRGTISDIKGPLILGHEAVGIVEEIGSNVKHVKVGDRVLVASTIACGKCKFCKRELYSQCDNANPKGHDAGTAFFGGTHSGLQAEKARIPFADTTLIKIPDHLTDEQVILVSDILPTAYMAVEMADIPPDDTVAVFGCGPVGQLVISCLKHLKVKHIFAIDRVPFRLEMAKKQGAHTINFDEKNPVKELKNLTKQEGPTKIIDAVGVDAEQPKAGMWHFLKNIFKKDEFKEEVKKIAPRTNIKNGNWIPGNGPSQVIRWAVEALAKAGTLSIIGVYPSAYDYCAIGSAMEKNLQIRMGNCNHKKYIPMLLNYVDNGFFDLLPFVTQKINFNSIVEAYKHFDKREDGWLKVVLKVS